MQILSDWQAGKPPTTGYWLTRDIGSSYEGALRWWDGETWEAVKDGAPMLSQLNREWRGLAFDPERVCELTALGATRINLSTRRDRIYVVQVKR